MKPFSDDTPLSELTVGDLLSIIRTATQQPRRRTVRGLQGLADLFGVSVRQAQRIKDSGVIDRAVWQKGRVIITDAELARMLWAEASGGRKHSNTI